MKKARTIVLFALAAVVSLSIMSCEIETISIMDRLAQFMTDLNKADRSDAYLNFDPDETEYYDAMKDPDFWDDPFPPVGTGETEYSLSDVDYEDPENVTANMYGPPDFSVTGDPWPVQFVMVKTGTDWFIHQFFQDGTEVIINLR
jgi:hypothetical protein